MKIEILKLNNSNIRTTCAVLLGGVVYPIIFYIVNLIDCSVSVQQFISHGLMPLTLIGIGSFIGVKSHEKWCLRFCLTLIAMIAIYASLIIFITSTGRPYGKWLIKFSIASAIFGWIGAVIKISNLKSKLPEFQVSRTQTYRAALNYRMHPIMRVLGFLIGSFFVISPLMILTVGKDEEYTSKIILMLVILFVCPVGMGLFFLSYAIPGKTPGFVLKYLKGMADKDSSQE